MAERRNWTEDEITVACYIYIYSDKVTVKEKRLLSSIFNRTEKAIGAKIDNIAKYDYEAIKKGRTYWENGSYLDEIVWKKFQETPEMMIKKAQEILLNSKKIDEYELFEQYPVMDTAFIDIGPGKERTAVIKARMNQNSFRKAVLFAANEKCCVTGIKERKSLIASHIKPWRICNPDEKTDIHNALCLNSLHDSLFDNYLMTIDENNNVYYAPSLEKTFGEEYFDSSVAKYDKVHVNEKNKPSKKYIEYHNSIFERKTAIKIK